MKRSSSYSSDSAEKKSTTSVHPIHKQGWISTDCCAVRWWMEPRAHWLWLLPILKLKSKESRVESWRHCFTVDTDYGGVRTWVVAGVPRSHIPYCTESSSRCSRMNWGGKLNNEHLPSPLSMWMNSCRSTIISNERAGDAERWLRARARWRNLGAHLTWGRKPAVKHQCAKRAHHYWLTGWKWLN